jgi:two-component system sensor histidine kinase BaeS
MVPTPDYVNDVVHALQSPLTLLRLNIEKALADEALGPASQRHLRAALREVTEMSTLVTGLLDLARAEQGLAIRDPAKVDLAVLAETVVDEHLAVAAEKGIITITFTHEGSVSVPGDQSLLKRALTNLVTNAIKYTGSGGHIKMTLGVDGARAVLRVSDTGAGIPAGALPHVFDRFFQLDPERSRETGGVGLGLSIARAIAEGHGGSLEAESQMGRGSTFTLRLPRLPESSAPER